MAVPGSKVAGLGGIAKGSIASRLAGTSDAGHGDAVLMSAWKLAEHLHVQRLHELSARRYLLLHLRLSPFCSGAAVDERRLTSNLVDVNKYSCL